MINAILDLNLYHLGCDETGSVGVCAVLILVTGIFFWGGGST